MLLPLGTRPSSRSRRRAYRYYPTFDRSTRLAVAIVPRRPGTMIEVKSAADVLAYIAQVTWYPTLAPQRYRQPRSFSPRLQARPLAYGVPAARLLCAGATPRYPAVAREFRLVLAEQVRSETIAASATGRVSHLCSTETETQLASTPAARASSRFRIQAPALEPSRSERPGGGLISRDPTGPWTGGCAGNTPRQPPLRRNPRRRMR